jgi:hypothetical protein
MKASELIELLRQEIDAFGDQEVTVFCPEHSGEGGDPVWVSGLGWFANADKNERSTFIECGECHQDGINDKAWSDAMDEVVGDDHFDDNPF